MEQPQIIHQMPVQMGIAGKGSEATLGPVETTEKKAQKSVSFMEVFPQ